MSSKANLLQSISFLKQKFHKGANYFLLFTSLS
ncbi:hypothetical protein Adeg_0822 [Ammonifex degensii KC4]|uniref:Uncharacterized protein n=1 Tax=Ammonifex degensii (strain DSM 10501 / KC4) TaxID=429009 RepID=C9RCI7_AMMDK|nr:hypothetical protein Adeg_0822 [Ammonifex degensii KC4]